jgi:CDP-glycerol glycerophosphotransferase
MDKKMVIFTAHSRKYNDSPKAIYEAMILMPEFKDFTLVWGLEDPEHSIIPGPAIKVKTDTLKYFKYTLKAKYWISCVNIERNLHYKKKECVYLNTWHGTPFKLIGNDAGKPIYNMNSIDFFCHESEYDKAILQKAFNIKPSAMMNIGLPRNDALHHVTDDDIIAAKSKLGLPMDKKIILYAPTWRDSEDSGATYAIKPALTIEKWKEKLKDEYILLFRTHTYTNTLLGLNFGDFIRNFSTYPDVNDLLIASDILISDYSSIMCDYSVLERPIICYAYDFEKYEGGRGLYPSFEKDVPSGILKTEEEVISYILNMNEQKEKKKVLKFKNKYSLYGGNATMECIKLLFKDVLNIN